MEGRISRNWPSKYVGENRYITAWEKRMIKAIEKKVDEEIAEKEAKRKASLYRGRSRVVVMEIESYTQLKAQEYRNAEIARYEAIYRKQRTLNILMKCGLNLEEFAKTWMGSCHRSEMLLGCVQDKIDGFDYDEDGARVPNGRRMNVKTMTVEYKNGVLRITDGVYTSEFRVDEHQLIFVNGEQPFKLTQVPTEEENFQMVSDLIEDMISDRISHDRKMEKSILAAQSFWVK